MPTDMKTPGGLAFLAAIWVIAVALLWFARPSMLALGNWNLPLFLGLFAGGLLVVGVPIAFCFALATLGYLTFATNAPVFVMMGRIDEVEAARESSSATHRQLWRLYRRLQTDVDELKDQKGGSPTST